MFDDAHINVRTVYVCSNQMKVGLCKALQIKLSVYAYSKEYSG